MTELDIGEESPATAATAGGKLRAALSWPRDPFSGLSHAVGMGLAVVGLVVLVTAAAERGDTWHVASFAVYGASLVLLYLASSLYHTLPLSPAGVARLRRFDHIAVFWLIAGTYAPFCLVTLRHGWGLTLMAVAGGLAIAGTVVKLAWMGAPRALTAGTYIAMGWVIVFAIGPLSEALPPDGVRWLFGGGITYTLGAVIYAAKRPDPWPGVFGFHEIWHLFVLAASACHFWAVYRYVLPVA